MNTNPSRGPYHFRAPSKIFWRTVRGKDAMVVHGKDTQCKVRKDRKLWCKDREFQPTF